MKVPHLILIAILGFTAISVTSIMIGILTGESEENLVSLYDITTYPYRYKDKTVTIKDYYYGSIHAVEWMHWLKEGNQWLYFKIKNPDSCPTLIYGAKYYFTGTLRFLENHSYVPYYLQDTEVKPIEPLPQKPAYSIIEIETHAYQLLNQEITTTFIYSDRGFFTSFFTDYENFSLIPGAGYLITGYLFVDSTYGFPYCQFRVTEAKPIM